MTTQMPAGPQAESPAVRRLTVKRAINETLREEMQRDPTVIILGCDVGVRGNPFGVTKGLYEEFGAARVLDTPISEAAIVGSSLGAAATGADRRADDERHADGAAEHVADLGDLVDQLVHADGDPV